MDSLVVAMVVYNIDELPCVSVYVSLCWFLNFGIQSSYKKFNSINRPLTFLLLSTFNGFSCLFTLQAY